MDIERIGKYKVLEEIGRGTMGRVYKAHDPVLNRFVALKTQSASPDAGDEMHKRFHREAQAAALLSHPNIVTVHDFGEEEELIFMAMELLEGSDLRDAIDRKLLPGLDQKVRVMEQICSALAFAHSKGVVHRDLKPANVHIQPNGQVKIVDFGLARISTSNMTQEGIVLGTPNYMSPEQALGDKVDARSDVFSAGAVFYELLTNHKPFDADSTPGVLFQVVHKEPPAIRQWSPDVPRSLVEVVEKAMVKDKKRRFQTAEEMRAALSAAGQEESPRAVRRAGARSAAYVEGTGALAVARPDASPRLAPTLSGQAATRIERMGRRSGRVAAARRGPPTAALLGLAALAAAGLTVGGYFWMRAQHPPTEAGFADSDRAEALTQVLVQTQLKLASRELADKNYRAAAEQAQGVLKVAPFNAEARRILREASERQAALGSAVATATQAVEAGDTAKASRELSRVLELDPRHPAAEKLTTRLDSAFRSRAEEAARSMKQAREESERAKATGSDGFAQATAFARDAEALFARGEYASATRAFLESRDAFDRAARDAKAPLPAPSVASAPPVAPPTAAAASTTAAPTPAPLPEPAAPAAVVRRFVGGATTIASRSAGGDLAGFDTADVKKRQIPDLAGRIEFEVGPAPAKAGEPYGVRIYLVNESRKMVRVKALSAVTTVNGSRTPASLAPANREVAPQQRALLGEVAGEWPSGLVSWSLDAVVTTDRDETGTSRLSWK